MITSKQRAKLRALANPLETIGQVGKGGLNDAIVTSTNEALAARELIKLRVLETCGLTAREAARSLAESCGAEVVQVIGSRFVLFRRNESLPGERQIEI